MHSVCRQLRDGSAARLAAPRARFLQRRAGARAGAVAAAPTIGGMDMQNSPPDVVQVPEFSPPAEVPTGPPVPAAGLPDGWTMEQWGHYGQQWLDNQQ